MKTVNSQVAPEVTPLVDTGREQTFHGPVQIRRDPTLHSFYGIGGRVGVLGGSFDPIQAAHLEIARGALAQLKLDRLVFIPAYQNPLKAQQPTAARDRLAMLKIALQQDPDFYFCPMELERAKTSYSIETALQIKQQAEAGIQLFFINGADCLNELHKWKDVHQLLAEVSFVTVPRADEAPTAALPQLAQHFSAPELKNLSSHFLDLKTSQISSTMIRTAIKAGRVPVELLPPGVAEYITENNLYR